MRTGALRSFAGLEARLGSAGRLGGSRDSFSGSGTVSHVGCNFWAGVHRETFLFTGPHRLPPQGHLPPPLVARRWVALGEGGAVVVGQGPEWGGGLRV